MKKVTIFTDGGSRGNPGPAASGFVLYDEAKNILHAEGVYLGETTNNVAEYTAVVLALEKAKEIGATHLNIQMDSELIVRQMTGIYKIKQPHIQELAGKVFRLLNNFTHYNFGHVRREFNKVADKLVNQALDAHKN